METFKVPEHLVSVGGSNQSVIPLTVTALRSSTVRITLSTPTFFDVVADTTVSLDAHTTVLLDAHTTGAEKTLVGYRLTFTVCEAKKDESGRNMTTEIRSASSLRPVELPSNSTLDAYPFRP